MYPSTLLPKFIFLLDIDGGRNPNTPFSKWLVQYYILTTSIITSQTNVYTYPRLLDNYSEKRTCIYKLKKGLIRNGVAGQRFPESSGLNRRHATRIVASDHSSTKSSGRHFNLHRSDCTNTLIYAHMTSRTLPSCDIRVGS
jgi:hypothetical protein